MHTKARKKEKKEKKIFFCWNGGGGGFFSFHLRARSERSVTSPTKSAHEIFFRPAD